MPTINQDCHITLTHPEINAGNPYGFLLNPESDHQPPAVMIQREVTSGGTITIRVFFDVLLADCLINPDGSNHSESRSEMYSMLIGYLEKTGSLTLTFAGGTITNIGALGHSATEKHTKDYTVVSCQYNNAGPYYGMIDTTDFENSIWDGTLSWAASYWR